MRINIRNFKNYILGQGENYVSEWIYVIFVLPKQVSVTIYHLGIFFLTKQDREKDC